MPLGVRSGMRLYVKDPSFAGGFRPAPLQIDPIDKDGHIKFNEDKRYDDKEIDAWDMLTFRTEEFGQRLDAKKEKLPCRGATTYELRDPATNRYAYLTNCGKIAAASPLFAASVRFAEEQHFLESGIYRYRFNPSNYMQFQGISFRNTAQSTWDTIAERSKLMIRADVKNFFSMNFDADEIESQLEAKRLGPVANLARLSFFLKILLFKIRMSLATDVAFYTDSSHIPMMVNIPVDAHKYLNPASGIIYTWILAPAALNAPRRISMPTLNPDEVKKGWKELAKIGLKSCVKEFCSYRYTVDIGGKMLSMDLGLERKLVERGFFPIYIEDAAKHKEAMGWELEPDSKGDVRTGIYFEVSGLSSGGHPWDFWLRLGNAAVGDAMCPVPLDMVKI